MCSNMCARPVLPMGSCTEPASTCVKNENTGASGRSQMMMVRPLASFLTVVRFSNEARSWLKASEQNTKQTMIVCVEVKRDFMCLHRRTLKIEVTGRRGELSNRSGGATVVLAAAELRSAWTGEGARPHTSCACPIRAKTIVYQTRQAFSDTMGCPALHPKACWNAVEFCTAPFTRQRPGECGSVSTRLRAS